MRIGELLVRKGLINEQQLDESLQAQTIYGGHLGTCLIELGHADEKELGRTLAEIAGVEYATCEMFQKIPRYVIQAIPRKLVTQHRLIPLRLENRVLDVALIDPTNLAALDEVGIATGYRTVGWIAPEIRIYQAMERYYDVPRKTRFVTLCRQLDEQVGFELEPSGAEARTIRPVEVGAGGGESERRTSVATACAPAAVAAPRAEADPGQQADDPERRLARLAMQLDRADTGAGIAQAVLEFAAVDTARAVLFGVKSNTAWVWRCAGIDRPAEALGEVELMVGQEPVFATLIGRNSYLGPPPDKPAPDGIFASLGIDLPAEILLVPISIDERMVALFYGDAGPASQLHAEVAHYVRMARKVGYALQILQLRRNLIGA